MSVGNMMMADELSYAELLADLPGGRPTWTEGLSDRAAHALVRDGWTLESLKKSISDGYDLTRIQNVGWQVASEIALFVEGK
jgi:hypothetical protein